MKCRFHFVFLSICHLAAAASAEFATPPPPTGGNDLTVQIVPGWAERTVSAAALRGRVAPMEGNALRFGTDNNAWSKEQYAYFRWKDPTDETVFYRVQVDDQGYMHPHMGGTVFVVK